MAISPSSSSFQHQFRSISLPCRLHPQTAKIEAELAKLKTWQSSLDSSTVPTSGETIRTGLDGLAELYSRVQELIDNPTTQQAFIQRQKGVLVEEALEGSIALLDVCNMAQDLLVMMKQNLQDLQSVLRRKGARLNIERNISAYNSLKKKVKKESVKCLGALKKMESQIKSCSLFDMNCNLSHVIRVLGEVRIVTIFVLQSLFQFLSVPDPRTRSGGWSLIKKLVVTRPREHRVVNEIGSVDDALQSLQECIRNNMSEIDVLQTTRRRLETLGNNMEELETRLDCVYRTLIRNRVSLLSILAQ